MRRQLTLFIVAVMMISLLLPFSSMVRGDAEEELMGFHDVTITTDPAVPPTGDIRPETDENIDVTVETSTIMDEAYLNVSAIKWNGEPVRGLEPSDPGRWTFDISDNGYSGTSLLNNIKYFPPGTEVTWNVHLINYADQSTYTSEDFVYEVKGAWHFNNSYDDAFYRNLVMDISPSIPPNAYDPVDITLEPDRRYNPDVEIGQAILNLRYENETVSEEGSLPFRNVDPVEGIEQVTIPGLPAGTEVEFSIYAWDDPDDARREIRSDEYNYTVDDGNTWQGVDFEDNIDMTTEPDVTGEDSIIGSDESVNVTIKSEDTSVPIEAAVIEYEIGGRGMDTEEGQDLFDEISSTHWYFEIPDFPAGTEISFRVRAYDIMRRDIVSQTYSYLVEEEIEEGVETTSFWVAVYDEGEPVGGANVIIQNETWIWEGVTNPFGQTRPTKMISDEPVHVHYGTYDITVEYEGVTKNESIELTRDGETTFHFYFNPTEEREDIVYASPVDRPPYYLIGLTVVGGLAGVMGYVLYHLRKNKDEQRGLAAGG